MSGEDVLAAGTRLEEFEIECELGRGGFGVTYLAYDTSPLERRVAIKEYLPVDFGTRLTDGGVGPLSVAHAQNYEWGLTRFLDEARMLAALDDPRIVRVYRVIEAWGTAYTVMAYVEGRSLQETLDAEGPWPEERVRALLELLLPGVEKVHEAGLVHRDIKPANVMLKVDGSPVLIDFGAARQAVGGRSRSVVLTDGYAPNEQYQTAAEDQGPWTDVYALGAVAYRALSGRVPVAAPTRMIAVARGRPDPLAPVTAASAGRVSEAFGKAVTAALSVWPEDRPRDVGAWRALLHPPPPPARKVVVAPGGVQEEPGGGLDGIRVAGAIDAALARPLGGPTVRSGLVLDDEAWNRMRPHLDRMWKHAQDLGQSLAEFLDAVMDMIGEGFGAAGVEAAVPRLTAWHEEMEAQDAGDQGLEDGRPGAAGLDTAPPDGGAPAEVPLGERTDRPEAGGEGSGGGVQGDEAIDRERRPDRRAALGGPTARSGLVIDDEAWERLKPHLKESWDHFKAAGHDTQEWLAEIVAKLAEIFGAGNLDTLPPRIADFVLEQEELDARDRGLEDGGPRGAGLDPAPAGGDGTSGVPPETRPDRPEDESGEPAEGDQAADGERGRDRAGRDAAGRDQGGRGTDADEGPLRPRVEPLSGTINPQTGTQHLAGEQLGPVSMTPDELLARMANRPGRAPGA